MGRGPARRGRTAVWRPRPEFLLLLALIAVVALVTLL
ncbi:hypothetical protein SAMN05421869_102571 [Nonomuraea jiangxiensis]|uniref:Uncharacterized protein n=1 Tax=Nonomuraea jiangxiensis TaxID=633440 RepID=A0A1G8DGX2_9ACTN|nr:hypothetical protein SAMN05421869_102571 [Nonomuraea jiangxiensis]